ncbi:hypothetical protein ABZY10_00065 [Streptomyces sp. NPDC006539]|uniref:hypothetical protein n=1 Tax=unclassified Streptomyces TaxID=2593676 RepID=UPI0033A792F6|nr:hypothetical protein OG987_27830 [Streptomyces sp. NBC_01620]
MPSLSIGFRRVRPMAASGRVSNCTTGFRLAAAVMMPTGAFMVLVIRSERPHLGL